MGTFSVRMATVRQKPVVAILGEGVTLALKTFPDTSQGVSDVVKWAQRDVQAAVERAVERHGVLTIASALDFVVRQEYLDLFRG